MSQRMSLFWWMKGTEANMGGIMQCAVFFPAQLTLLSREHQFKERKNTMSEFGPIIDTYTMRDAVADGAVVPLIYEGRLVEPEMNASALDTWFERLTTGLSDAQKADLKKKYSRANMLSGLDKVVTCRAFDISEHSRLPGNRPESANSRPQ